MKRSLRRHHSDERGIAMILALFMVLALSVLGSSLMFISQSETWSSSNYRITSQARYAAESGVHHAANFLLSSTSYVPPSAGSATDPLTNYNITVTPVLGTNGNPIVLSSDTAKWPANYPYATAQTNFANTVKNENITLNGSRATYHASAKLLSMQSYSDAYGGSPRTIQTWEITAVGTVEGSRNSAVEVSAVIERQLVPLYRYAAFAKANGCAALSFAGGATTDSYDSSAANIAASFQNSGGNVGTNGNLTEVGNPTQVNGTLSTPRSGVGACTANNITALTVQSNPDFHVTGGLVELPQAVDYPTPTLDYPNPPQVQLQFQKSGTSSTCPGMPTAMLPGLANCVQVNNVGWTITPNSTTTPVVMGDVRVNSGAALKLAPGKYVMNSLVLNGSGTIEVIGSGNVEIQIAGQNQSIALDLTGGGIVNASMDPARLQFIYPGTGEVKLNGNSTSAALIYAPNATSNFSGNTDFYGAIITNVLSATGGMAIHYDRNLQKKMTTASNPMMSSFTWKTF